MRTNPHTHGTRNRRKPAPMDDFLADRQFEADFSACGQIECDELDDSDDAEAELGFLADRVRATRDFGA